MRMGTAHASAAANDDRLAQAWTHMRHDPSIQFNLPPPDPPTPPPAWLEALGRIIGKVLEPIGRFLRYIGSFMPDAPYARIILWTLIAIGAAALVWAISNRLRHGEWRWRIRRTERTPLAAAEEEWAPDEAGARSWLEEAEALARDGRYAEAIHHLLFRSVEDIARRRPGLIRPALTSRELSNAQGIPGRARDLFASIARLVEQSLFGGRAVGQQDWQQARSAYTDFALASSWRS